ncbi:MAG: succinate dehydrogenase assembly factor 2 [Gallionella sp.]|nr:succinate dehydrogenase assembly factor 2 [Gallionella sp.]
MSESEALVDHGKMIPAGSIADPLVIQRMRWRCRRGLLELDLTLGRFVDEHYADMNEQEQRHFDELLDMPDNLLWDMIAGRTEQVVQDAAKETLRPLLEKIRAA